MRQNWNNVQTHLSVNTLCFRKEGIGEMENLTTDFRRFTAQVLEIENYKMKGRY